MKRITASLLTLLLVLSLLVSCAGQTGSGTVPGTGGSSGSLIDLPVEPGPSQPGGSQSGGTFSMDQVPAYAGEAYVTVHDGIPYFDTASLEPVSLEEYSPLDGLGRCGVAYSIVGQDLMPTEERGSISSVKPSGWQSTKYDVVDGRYLYNRCHLIGFQLTAENANRGNLITGTRCLNIDGMLPFENMTADYVKETGNHVAYRVTPCFEGDELVARGVLMEGWSIEDEGEGVCFCVFCYNVQPGVEIDYATGESRLASENGGESGTYVLNTKTKKFHLPSCSNAKDITQANREEFTGSRDDVIARGFDPCRQCRP